MTDQFQVQNQFSSIASSSLPPHGLQDARLPCRLPFPSPGDLPDSGIEPRSPALEADALPSEPPGKYLFEANFFFYGSEINNFVQIKMASPVAQKVKVLPAVQETWVRSLGQEDEMETHSSILAWKIPWTEEPSRLQSMGL